MISAQDAKYVPCVPPAAIKDDAAFVSVEIDTKGWSYLELIFHIGATDIALAAMTVTESDTTATGHTAFITYGTTLDKDGNASALAGAGADNDIYVCQIDLKGRKRFIDVAITAGDGSTGTFLAAVGRLSRGSIGPDAVAEIADSVIRV